MGASVFVTSKSEAHCAARTATGARRPTRQQPANDHPALARSGAARRLRASRPGTPHRVTGAKLWESSRRPTARCPPCTHDNTGVLSPVTDGERCMHVAGQSCDRHDWKDGWSTPWHRIRPFEITGARQLATLPNGQLLLSAIRQAPYLCRAMRRPARRWHTTANVSRLQHIRSVETPRRRELSSIQRGGRPQRRHREVLWRFDGESLPLRCRPFTTISSTHRAIAAVVHAIRPRRATSQRIHVVARGPARLHLSLCTITDLLHGAMSACSP